MSTDRIIDVRVRDAFPHPIAAAWHRAFTVTGEAKRIEQLLACFEITLRTVASYLVLDYLRGPRGERVEEALRGLDRPSLGHWAGVVRESVAAIHEREAPDPFFPEAVAWRFGPRGEPTAAAHLIDELVRRRNDRAHGAPKLSETVTAGEALEIVGRLRDLFRSLSWLTRYRLLRVQRMDGLRPVVDDGVRVPRYRGRVSIYMGRDGAPVPISLIVGTSLLTDATYLAAPTGDRLLEVTPFLRILVDKKTDEDRLHLLGRFHKRRQVVLRNDSTGSEIRDWVGGTEPPVAVDRWLDRSDHSDLVVDNPLPEELAAPTAAPAAELRCVAGRRFEVRAPLGSGGYGTVHLVWDDLEDEELALKVMCHELSQDEACRERFKREAKLMRRVKHPHVLQVRNVGQLEDGRLWLTMAVVSGGDLAERIDCAPPDERQAREWMGQMLSAMCGLHERTPPIVHRDIKPSNWLVGENDALLLSDFGIALHGEDPRLTNTHERVGSNAFMSPEQRTGDEVGTPSDVYSLGLVFHELLAGEALVPGRPPGVGGELGQLIEAMTRPDPDARPSARDALERLNGELGTDAAPGAIGDVEDEAPVAPNAASSSHLLNALGEPVEVLLKREGGSLLRGARGPLVYLAQRRLVELGYEVDVDGRYGKSTSRAVKRFQESRELKLVDGLCGPETMGALLPGAGRSGALPHESVVAAFRRWLGHINKEYLYRVLQDHEPCGIHWHDPKEEHEDALADSLAHWWLADAHVVRERLEWAGVSASMLEWACADLRVTPGARIPGYPGWWDCFEALCGGALEAPPLRAREVAALRDLVGRLHEDRLASLARGVQRAGVGPATLPRANADRVEFVVEAVSRNPWCLEELLNKDDLKGLCGALGVARTGTKLELVDRLLRRVGADSL